MGGPPRTAAGAPWRDRHRPSERPLEGVLLQRKESDHPAERVVVGSVPDLTPELRQLHAEMIGENGHHLVGSSCCDELFPGVITNRLEEPVSRLAVATGHDQ